MRRNLLLGLAALVVAAMVTGSVYYRGFYRPTSVKPLAFESIEVRSFSPSGFTDAPKGSEGRVIVDLSSDNNFTLSDANLLNLRLASRGLSVEFFEKEGRDKNGKNITLGDKLKEAKALVVIAPKRPYSDEELGAIKDLVKNGGRLLLVGDPTRPSQINRIAVPFGLIFENDYLYDIKENEGNYRNVYFTKFKDSKITADLKKVVLFTAGSISSKDGGLVFTDENTFSTRVSYSGSLSPIAISEGDKVLGVSDLTFMTEPYGGFHDNSRLVANIADWLAGAERKPSAEEAKSENADKAAKADNKAG